MNRKMIGEAIRIENKIW